MLPIGEHFRFKGTNRLKIKGWKNLMYSWVPKENQDIIIRHQLARIVLLVQWYRQWHVQCTSAIKVYTFTIILQKKKTLNKWNSYALKQLFTHPFTLFASMKPSLQSQGQMNKRISSNKKIQTSPPLCGLLCVKMTTIKGPWATWNGNDKMTTEAFHFK